MKQITTYLVDDHQVLIDGISLLLSNQPNIEIIGKNTNPLFALEEIIKLQPKVVLTDIQMPEMTGIELTKKIKMYNKEIKILALSMFGDYYHINEMKEAGVNGYILKNCSKEGLIKAVNDVYYVGNYFSQEVNKELENATNNIQNQPKLTFREIEIVQLIAKEYSNAKIAETLFISERTVETHRKNIFRKTKTKSVLGLIKFATTNNVL